MCGIVGYIGENGASPMLLDGLKKLEYRGYDSAGIAVYQNGGVQVVKTKGRIADLEQKLSEYPPLVGTVGIGHTRWATHGAPTDANAHPHKGGDGRITLVHNGIIENYIELKSMLETAGYRFRSETDTEVLAHLFAYYYKDDLLDAMQKVMRTVRGSYATAVLSADAPDCIIAAKKDSPLIVGKGDGENFLASDIPAVLKYTRECYLLEDGEIVLLKKDGISFFDRDGAPLKKEIYRVTWDAEAAEKGGYAHFMKKEIAEQPKAVRDTLSPRLRDGKITSVKFILSRAAVRGTWVWRRNIFSKRRRGFPVKRIWQVSFATATRLSARAISVWLSVSRVKRRIPWRHCAKQSARVHIRCLWSMWWQARLPVRVTM